MTEIQVTKYQSDDGTIWDTAGQAISHDKFNARLKSGETIVCTTCGGAGRIDPTGDDRSYVTCPTCEGRKYLTRTVVYK